MSARRKLAEHQAEKISRWRSKFHAQTDPTNDYGYQREMRRVEHDMAMKKGFGMGDNTNQALRTVKQHILSLEHLQRAHMELKIPPHPDLPEMSRSTTKGSKRVLRQSASLTKEAEDIFLHLPDYKITEIDPSFHITNQLLKAAIYFKLDFSSGSSATSKVLALFTKHTYLLSAEAAIEFVKNLGEIVPAQAAPHESPTPLFDAVAEALRILQPRLEQLAEDFTVDECSSILKVFGSRGFKRGSEDDEQAANRLFSALGRTVVRYSLSAPPQEVVEFLEQVHRSEDLVSPSTRRSFLQGLARAWLGCSPGSTMNSSNNSDGPAIVSGEDYLDGNDFGDAIPGDGAEDWVFSVTAGGTGATGLFSALDPTTELLSVIKAFGQAGPPVVDRRLMQCMSMTVLRHMSQFQPQHLAAVLHSFSLMQTSRLNDALFRSSVERQLILIEQQSVGTISMTLSAISRMNLKVDAIFSRFSRQLLHIAPAMGEVLHVVGAVHALKILEACGIQHHLTPENVLQLAEVSGSSSIVTAVAIGKPLPPAFYVMLLSSILSTTERKPNSCQTLLLADVVDALFVAVVSLELHLNVDSGHNRSIATIAQVQALPPLPALIVRLVNEGVIPFAAEILAAGESVEGSDFRSEGATIATSISPTEARKWTLANKIKEVKDKMKADAGILLVVPEGSPPARSPSGAIATLEVHRLALKSAVWMLEKHGF